MENINDIILKSKLLFKYDTRKTLTENVNELDEDVSELAENLSTMRIIAQGTDDAIRTMGDDVIRYLGGKPLTLQGGRVIRTSDEFLAAIKKIKGNGALTDKSKSDLAKALMKINPTPISGDARKSLIRKAAEMALKDANYAAKNGDELANILKTKGYQDDIANEIGKKFNEGRARLAKAKTKTPKPNPQDVDNAVKTWGESIKNWPWNKLLKWGLGVGLSVAVLYGIYKLTHKDEPDLPPDPPKPTERYRDCTGTYTQGCKSDVIKQVQTCLGVVPDGKFWVKTQAALEAKGFSNGFKDSDVSKICGGNTPTPVPELSPEQQTAQDYGVTPQPNPQPEVQTTNDSIDNY